jgi:hypothetical protein
VQVLAYGALLGGFLSDFWLGKADPSDALEVRAAVLLNSVLSSC